MAFAVKTEAIVDRFIKALENGTPPWIRPWGTMAPYNAATKHRYTGMNYLLLSQDTEGPAYMTWNNIKANGGSIKAGTEGRQIVFLAPVKVNEKDSNGKKTGAKKTVNLLRYYYVYPISAVTGLPEHFYPKFKECEFTPNELAEQIVVANNPKINFGGDRAYYMPSEDRIQMPEVSRFTSTTAYYNTLFHEMGHWTRHESRLNRTKEGQEGYAKEELIAEITSAMVCQSCGLNIETMKGSGNQEFDNSTAYCAHWAGVLRESSINTITQAASRASAAFEFLTKAVKATKEENCLALVE